MPRKYTPLEKFEKWQDNNNIKTVPIKMIGTICNIDTYFLPWVFSIGKECGLDVKKIGLSDTFNGILEKKNVKIDLLYILDDQCCELEYNDVLIGMDLCQFDEHMSVKRMRMEIFETLKKIEFFQDSDGTFESDLFDNVGIISSIIVEEK